MTEVRQLLVALVIEADIATTQLIERVLNACRFAGVRYKKLYVSTLRFSDFDEYTIPLFVRCGDPALRIWIKLLKRAGHPYLYYLDDNFWELQGDSPVARHYQQPKVRQSLEFAISNAYRVITNSEVLASFLRRFTSRLVVLPAFFDFTLIESGTRERTEELRIGFAGSTTRVEDLELIRPVVQRVLDRLPNAVFEFAGAIPRGIRPGPRIRFFEYTDSYPAFIRFQLERNWAIGLAPLVDNTANRAKTNNKYREYGACGIAGIYSDMPPYQHCVEPGVTGLRVDAASPDAWFSAVLRLGLDADFRRQIAVNAERDVREKYCVNNVARQWQECIDQISTETRAHPSHLARAYITGFLPETAMRQAVGGVRILGLQVQDAYRKGGVRLVLSKTAERLSGAFSRV